MENIWIAAIVAFFGLLTAGMPILLARQAAKTAADAITAANLRADQLAERVSVVADKAEAASRLLVMNTANVAKAAQDTSEKLQAVAQITSTKLESVARMTSDKLDVLHLLVNSNYTAAKQAEYDATVREAAMMHEVIDLKRAAGHEPNVSTVAALDATNIKVAELRVELDERIKQAKVVVTQQEIQKQHSDETPLT